MNRDIPVLDLQALAIDRISMAGLATDLHNACRQHGFFYIVNHGVDETLLSQLYRQSEIFFSLPSAEKMKIHMSLSGKAWRGYFPVGEELTSGHPDAKEGIYFGEEATSASKILMHGHNLYPEGLPQMKATIENYMVAMRKLGDLLMEIFALSLDLEQHYIQNHLANPAFTLFRIFHYPALANHEGWGVGEHTDYGLLTILLQDEVDGLQIKSNGQWVDAPVIPGTFVCNIGDMMERLTGGLYVSTPHRVKNTSGVSRYSFPFFYDPNWNAHLEPLYKSDKATASRWDGQYLFGSFSTYGDYLQEKVRKVFPDLSNDKIK